MAESIFQSLPKELPAPTMSDMLLCDHRDTTALLHHFRRVANSSDNLMKEKLTDAIGLVIRLHSEGEFRVLYPFMSKTLGDKQSGVPQALDEHHTIEEEVLQAMKLRKEGGDELGLVMDDVLKDFTDHMRHEEDQWVPALLQNVSESELADVALQFMRAKETAPLEPQPQAAAK